MSGLRSNGTDLGGPGYVHPRSDKYRDNFDDIFGHKCTCTDCPGDDCKCECTLKEGGEQSK
jgi:hypothetical protein